MGRVAIGVLAAVCAVPAFAQQPEPLLPAENGWILFASNRDAPETANFETDPRLAGSRARTTTTSSRPSSDGSVIAFASDRPVQLEDDFEIYAVRPDGTGLRPLTTNDVDDRSPAWSPDGTRIAFTSGRTPGVGNSELWTMAPSGASQSRVQLAAAQEPWGMHVWSEVTPAWSPDGR